MKQLKLTTSIAISLLVIMLPFQLESQNFEAQRAAFRNFIEDSGLQDSICNRPFVYAMFGGNRSNDILIIRTSKSYKVFSNSAASDSCKHFIVPLDSKRIGELMEMPGNISGTNYVEHDTPEPFLYVFITDSTHTKNLEWSNHRYPDCKEIKEFNYIPFLWFVSGQFRYLVPDFLSLDKPE